MKSIYFKNFLATAIMVLVSFLMIGVAFVFIGQGYIIKSHRDNMESNARVISRLTTSLVYEEGLTDLRLRILLNGTSLISGNHIFITNDEGLIISCSDELGRCQHLGRSVDASYINTLEQQGSLDIVTDLGGLFSSQRYVFAMAMTVADSGAPVGYIFVSTDRSTIMGAWSAFIWVFFAVTLAVLFLALVLSLVVSKKMAEPLDEMTAAARRFAHGDFSVRVREDKGTDELAALTSSFNNMADSLERSEQQRNEFIANVSHELKTPMTTIAGFADGILDGTIPKEQEDKYLATIADETRRLSRLVRHMLSLSRMESQGSDLTKRRDFDLNELIIRTLLSFDGRTEEKGLDMQLQLPEDHMSVTADPDSITQVLYNLLDNAVKFASEGTAVTISLWKQGGKAYVSVKNRGETIPADDLPLIFDRFHKSDRSRSLDRDGVGLGLYLVKSILDAHNEDIAVTSRDGVTDFVFTLTLAREPKQKAEPRKKPEQRKKPEPRKKAGQEQVAGEPPEEE